MSEPTLPPTMPASTLLLLLFRNFLGYVVLLSCVAIMLKQETWYIGGLDAVFAAVLLALVVLRLRQSREGAAPPRTARLSALAHLGGGILCWVGANSVHLTV